LLGNGTFGTVNRGVDLTSGELVAIKRLPFSLTPDSSDEVEAMLRLTGCSNVIGIRETFQDGKAQSIVMDAAIGGELFDQVAAAPEGMAEMEARRIFWQMASGVAQMHSRGVAHRDLKLENAVFDARGELRWIDFGLAHLYSKQPSAERSSEGGEGGFEDEGVDTAVGSESYMAPELVRLRDARTGVQVDARKADIWALGVCLFAMVAGFVPLARGEGGEDALASLASAQAEGACGVAAIYAAVGDHGRRGNSRARPRKRDDGKPQPELWPLLRLTRILRAT